MYCVLRKSIRDIVYYADGRGMEVKMSFQYMSHSICMLRSVPAGSSIPPLIIKDNPHFPDVQKLGSLDPATGIKSTRNSAALPNKGPQEMG